MNVPNCGRCDRVCDKDCPVDEYWMITGSPLGVITSSVCPNCMTYIEALDMKLSVDRSNELGLWRSA